MFPYAPISQNSCIWKCNHVRPIDSDPKWSMCYHSPMSESNDHNLINFIASTVEAMRVRIDTISEQMATKVVLANLRDKMATKQELAALRDEMATKDDLARVESNVAR